MKSWKNLRGELGQNRTTLMGAREVVPLGTLCGASVWGWAWGRATTYLLVVFAGVAVSFSNSSFSEKITTLSAGEEEFGGGGLASAPGSQRGPPARSSVQNCLMALTLPRVRQCGCTSCLTRHESRGSQEAGLLGEGGRCPL